MGKISSTLSAIKHMISPPVQVAEVHTCPQLHAGNGVMYKYNFSFVPALPHSVTSTSYSVHVCMHASLAI